MKTLLYINPLHAEIHFLIFQEDTTILQTLPKNLNTASTFPKMLVDLVDQYAINEIYSVTGPGPFTLMRVITLAINAIRYTRNIEIKSCHFFDLIGWNTIPIIEANTHEYLIRQNQEIIMIPKELLPPWTYEGILWSIVSTETIKYIQYKEIKNNLISVFSKKLYETKIVPLYFKPPHITWPKI